MIEKRIKEGRKLLERTEREYNGQWAKFPLEERVAEQELNAWYRGITTAIESEFGSESKEAHVLRSGFERVGGG